MRQSHGKGLVCAWLPSTFCEVIQHICFGAMLLESHAHGTEDPLSPSFLYGSCA